MITMTPQIPPAELAKLRAMKLKPTPIAQGVAAAFGFLTAVPQSCIKLWLCPCQDPRKPKRLTLCPICGGSKQVYSI